MHGVQSVTLIIGFIHGQRIVFTLCDHRRSEGVVTANTLKTPTDEEKCNHNSEALSTELLKLIDNSLDLLS